MHLGNDSLGQIHIRATTGKHQAGTNQKHGWAGSGLARIKTMADQDRGWPGSGLVWTMADQDHGWSGFWLGRIATGSCLAMSLAGRNHGWSGSSLVRIMAGQNQNKTGTASGSIMPQQKRIWNMFEQDLAWPGPSQEGDWFGPAPPWPNRPCRPEFRPAPFLLRFFNVFLPLC